jgi:hydrogenase nickel incorporation protein HypA/HybF
MHELGVTQSILQVVLEHAQKAGAGRVQRIHLVVGDLAGVVGESIQFYFDFISRETLAQGAELVLRRDPARFRCPACGHEYEGESAASPGLLWACPQCGEMRPEVIGGRLLQVESIEVDE